jgi:biotin carboxylase
MKRKLLMLGGADIQVTAIQRAKELGYHVITCDYLPNNPGHRYSDEYHNVSTTDLEAVLAVARRCGIHGISAYASDPAAVTAAYVSQELGLPGDPFAGVEVIQDKVGFRRVQAELGIPAPGAAEATDADQVKRLLQDWPDGGILKPVDTSGSKGVHRILPGMDLDQVRGLLDDARSFSRAKRVIVEEYLPRKSCQMTGDALVVDGKVRFWCFGDVHFNDRVNGLVPRGVTIPGTVPEGQVREAMAGVQRVIDHLGLRQGVYNIDLFVDRYDRPIVVDIGARNGGNMLNTLYHCRTGVDLMTLSLQLAMGEPVSWEVTEQRERFIGHCVIHSTLNGTFEGIRFSERIEPYIFYRSLSVKPGDQVGAFINSGHRLGLLLLEFPSVAEMQDIYDDIYAHMILEVRS